MNLEPQPGMPAAELDTPALVLDLDALDRNIERMAMFTRRTGMRWRPHAKAHKSAALALLLMRAGAVGVCVQKTSEAECLARLGVHDIYLSNEVIAPPKLDRVAVLVRQLAADKGRLGIAVDSTVGVQRLADALRLASADAPASIDVFVEIDIGQHRCGVTPGPVAVLLAREIAKHPALRFAGLQAYHGGAQHIRSVADRRAAIGQSADLVRQTVALLRAAGFAVPLVTGGGTGSFALEAETGVWGELQCGSFLFMDADYSANEDAADVADGEAAPDAVRFEHSLFVQSQIMSVSADHAVCDAGHKSHAIDSGLPKVFDLGAGHGLVYGNGGDEHGVLRRADDPSAATLPALGDLIWLIPGHCDPTVNLHDRMVGVRGGLQHGTVERVIAVDARGAVT